MLSITDLEKSYSTKKILNGVNLKIKKGEILSNHNLRIIDEIYILKLWRFQTLLGPFLLCHRFQRQGFEVT
ncbi:hypothetical protein NGI46_02790 [Peribacillus butanolivorans]|uniref:hypothetical protein n=1 Tax=Peribacillus butanolivorans TaxID=421767 RepID=UPI00207D2593|nr:hypothetical protein [Peribacillus butanolivorans]MCO0596385.1 hypothetical protein [Peribacillus butanolivorans]